MIIKNTIDNEPILSNVGQVGEFRIRNSAKAFSILSSGLYSNKIRAIIREYSCNAVDSHTEAGRTDTPFDVHLPNSLEPWFAVRDYGVGLDEQQVRNIFTTYFESTKNETDDLIGGLGLGSKSAFSYTDNFTIVAVKNGMKRVYTAFINEHGVPSIAPMGEEGSDEPTGVEIRFAVENSFDFRKFLSEAQQVYKHFKLRPVISGGIGEFKFIEPEYTDVNIIPGVHYNGDNHYSYAVMGNIEYPLNVPRNMDLGEVGHLLECSLTIEFAIGELDIQASREGLSYIPETVAAIKNKLEALNAILADKVAADINDIKNPWQKVYALLQKMNTKLWRGAVKKYLTDTKFNLITSDNRWDQVKPFLFSEEELVNKYNIKISAFCVKSGYNGYNPSVSSLPMKTIYQDDGTHGKRWEIKIDKTVQFVENDTSVGAWTRAKHHWKNTKDIGRHDSVYVLEKSDKKKPMNLKAFYKAIATPPAEQKRQASTLMQKERAVGIGKDVSILKLEKRDHNHHLRSDDMVWRDAGRIALFDDTKTYYYLPLSGFQTLGACKEYSMQTVVKSLKDSGILTETVHGVRKADIADVQNKPNWVNLDDYVRAKLAQNNSVDMQGLIKEAIEFDAYFRFPYVQNHITDANSPYLTMFNQFVGAKTINRDARRGFETLCNIYNVTAGKVNVNDEIAKYKKEMIALHNRYPLISDLSRHYRNNTALSDYINAIDLMKK